MSNFCYVNACIQYTQRYWNQIDKTGTDKRAENVSAL